MIFPALTFSQSDIIDKVERLIDSKEYKQSEETLKEILKNDPDNLSVLEKLGDVYSHQKEWGKAVTCYKKLKELQPNVANNHYKYGGALGMKALGMSKLKAVFNVGDIRNAFIKAIELDPNHIDAHWALVEYYVQIPGIVGGSKRKALQVTDKLQKISAVDGYLARGYVHEYKGDPKLAEESYRMAIKVGGSLNCYQKLTSLYESTTNEPHKAIKNIEETQKKHERNALHYQIGKVSAEYNVELDKGLQCLQQFVANYSVADGVPIEWAYLRLAQIYRLKENKEQAKKWVHKALMVRATFEQAQKEKELIYTL